MVDMKKLLLAFFLLTCTLFGVEIAGKNIADKTNELLLNGAGIRDKYFLDMYIGALYLKTKQSDATKIINENSEMSMKLHILSSLITSEKMESSTQEGFEKALNGDTTSLKKEIEEFISVFKEEIKIDDVYDLVYTPNVGVDIYKNTNYKKTIKGLEFKKVLFGIWLGKEPVQESLKKRMLGL